ncbi:hypothetical protein BC567DRAFT_227322 [Phyllosticta citribraziliensis]
MFRPASALGPVASSSVRAPQPPRIGPTSPFYMPASCLRSSPASRAMAPEFLSIPLTAPLSPGFLATSSLPSRPPSCCIPPSITLHDRRR